MASFSLTDAFVLINAANMSGMFTKLTLKVSAAELDNTAFGMTWHSRIGGLKDYELDVSFNQDFAAAQVDALIWPLFGTVVTFEARPTSAARAVTNPAFTGSILISDYTPLDGSVGDLAGSSFVWKGAAALLRQTS